jgi:hypothetical protein
MVLNISISHEAEAALKAKAAAAGIDVETYAARQLELLARPLPPLQQISGPIAQAAANMSDDELAELLEQEKHAARKDRRARD